MRILIANDDGIDAPGLAVLERIAAKFSDDVWVVAPDKDNSGASHAITLSDPLRMRQLSEKRFVVNGKPTDCVILGVRHVLNDKKPDLILSGVNRGQNIANDVTYSGTIACAMTGALWGIRSIALSQSYQYHSFDREAGHQKVLHWDTAELLTPAIIKKVLDAQVPEEVVTNVNFPACKKDDVVGTMVTAQGRHDRDNLRVIDRIDARGNPYFWFGFGTDKSTPAEGTDIWALENNYVSITPLSMDLTDKKNSELLGKFF